MSSPEEGAGTARPQVGSKLADYCQPGNGESPVKKIVQIVVLLLVLASTFSTTAVATGNDPWPTSPCPITGCK